MGISNDLTSSNGNTFEGIWNRKHKPKTITNTAEKYVSQLPEIGAEVKPRKGWGILSPLIALATYFILQAVILAVWVASDPNTDKVEVLANITTNSTFILLNSIGGYIVWVGAMFITTKLHGKKSFVKEYLFSFKKKDFLWGPIIAVALAGFMILVNLLIAALGIKAEGNANWIKDLDGIGIILIPILIVSLLGPFCEELFFRGYFLQGVLNGRERALKRAQLYGSELMLKVTTWLYSIRNGLAIVLSSVVFGFMHIQTDLVNSIITISATTLIGVVLAIMTVKMNRLGPAIVTHICYNSINMAIFFIF